ncbi:hypothetical protein CI610_03282 [invertebrate metagenome]|uniref:Uncharacterized protein n=1 Tax=invertebrate metagenome TaxID=1711999 RepID=A0A2H9T3J4_9ZZZZ
MRATCMFVVHAYVCFGRLQYARVRSPCDRPELYILLIKHSHLLCQDVIEPNSKSLALLVNENSIKDFNIFDPCGLECRLMSLI